MLDKIRIVKQRFDEINDLIIQPDVISDQKRYIQLNKEYKDLKKIVDKGLVYETLMKNITEDLNSTVLKELGIEVVDIRVKRIDLPQEVSSQVFRRMTAEREKEARELRSTGKEKAEKIRASADRERTIELANAYRDAEELRGEGDAEAASVYANAYQRDPEFYSFVRSLNAYKSAFASKADIMLLEPDSDFFKYLNKQDVQYVYHSHHVNLSQWYNSLIPILDH